MNYSCPQHQSPNTMLGESSHTQQQPRGTVPRPQAAPQSAGNAQAMAKLQRKLQHGGRRKRGSCSPWGQAVIWKRHVRGSGTHHGRHSPRCRLPTALKPPRARPMHTAPPLSSTFSVSGTYQVCNKYLLGKNPNCSVFHSLLDPKRTRPANCTFSTSVYSRSCNYVSEF